MMCSSFVVMSDCICLGETLSYQCTTQGAISTVWQGSAFQCISSNILLRHSQYTTPQGASGICNDGLITGNSLRIEEHNCYTSQLNVTISEGLNGQTVQCATSGGQVVGTNNIAITTGICAYHILYLQLIPHFFLSI